ncbi:MAG: XTP/dITP diphosphatase [Oscillospiraceae bacterium]
MEFLVATNNAHKLQEMQRILQKMGHKAVSLQQAGIDIDVEETGKTFAQNAFLKANEVCKISGRPTIADDSGLEVDALDGVPGVYSARYAGEGHDDAANRKQLLQALQNVPQGQRAGRFVSAIALVLPNGALLEVNGTCEGQIGFEEKGDNGFGYDCLFYVGEKSFAERTAEEKDAISHRAVALRQLEKALPDFLLQKNMV